MICHTNNIKIQVQKEVIEIFQEIKLINLMKKKPLIRTVKIMGLNLKLEHKIKKGKKKDSKNLNKDYKQ